MNKILKYAIWFYLLIYTVMQILTITMVIITDNATAIGLAQSGMVLIPAFVVAVYLKRNNAHTILTVVGAISVALPLSDAHKFASIDNVTLGMYVWFAPMLLLMLFIIFKGISSKHNKSSNLTCAENAPPS